MSSRIYNFLNSEKSKTIPLVTTSLVLLISYFIYTPSFLQAECIVNNSISNIILECIISLTSRIAISVGIASLLLYIFKLLDTKQNILFDIGHEEKENIEIVSIRLIVKIYNHVKVKVLSSIKNCIEVIVALITTILDFFFIGMYPFYIIKNLSTILNKCDSRSVGVMGVLLSIITVCTILSYCYVQLERKYKLITKLIEYCKKIIDKILIKIPLNKIPIITIFNGLDSGDRVYEYIKSKYSTESDDVYVYSRSMKISFKFVNGEISNSFRIRIDDMYCANEYFSVNLYCVDSKETIYETYHLYNKMMTIDDVLAFAEIKMLELTQSKSIEGTKDA